MNGQELLNHLNELIFVIDPQTYHLLYANTAAQEAMAQPFTAGSRCHQAFCGRETPCEDCQVCGPRPPFRVWDQEETTSGGCYILREKPIDWDGIPARLVTASDITGQDLATRRVRMQLQVEQMLVECIRRLTAAEGLEEALQAVLSGIGEFYGADRAFILELNCERTMGNNTFEWCAPGIRPRLQFGADIPVDRISFWKEAIEDETAIRLSSIEQIREEFPPEYEWMKRQGIQNLMAAPFHRNVMSLGYIGVENPSRNTEDPSLLQSISYFIINELQKRRLHSELEYQGCHDSMTGFYNRFHYEHYLNSAGMRPPSSVGIIFCDINGLKEINDSRGHAAGDLEIRRVAQGIRECFPDALLFRIGGDEFIVVCEEIEQERFQGMILDANDFFLRKSLCFVSTGAVWREAPCDLSAMCREADELMYQAKERYYSDEAKDRRRHY